MPRQYTIITITRNRTLSNYWTLDSNGYHDDTDVHGTDHDASEVAERMALEIEKDTGTRPAVVWA